ncbi:hypothetical protein ACFSBI_10755 [Amnibacterium endophyticum]|uniref:Uncharacterized protein n=2 Tax=Amnibacterium endophyticum TaxID=2109337 RepID=A0ABW4LER5_9MICO
MVFLLSALVVLGVLSAVAGLVVVRRVMGGIDEDADPGDEVGLVRLRAQVATGSEQTLVALVRELQVQRGADGVGYGELYVDADADGLVVRTMSVLDRGLVAPLTLRPGAHCTDVTYAIVQLPQDEALHQVALQFEARLISALRRIDADSQVRLAGTTMRDLTDGVWAPSAAQERAARR